MMFNLDCAVSVICFMRSVYEHVHVLVMVSPVEPQISHLVNFTTCEELINLGV